ncbi:MAG TPA: diguanylate cyclase [Spirochaetota bacterium]|nr:diguanylate cyclase [Spirochaetota bacterium]
MNYKKLFLSIIILFTLSFFGIIIVIFATNNMINLDDPKKILLNDFNYQKVNLKNPHVFSYEKSISLNDFKKIEGEYVKIIIYRLAGQSYNVYLNDILIGSIGSGINSNIWNSIHSFDIDKKSLKENNLIKFCVVGFYEVGLISIPIIITSSDDGNKIYSWFNFLINIYTIVIGSLIVCFFLLISFAFSKNSFNFEYFYFGLATIFLAIYVLDNITIYKISSSLLYFKKIVYSSLFISIGFISLAVYQHFKNKIIFYSGVLLFISIVPILFFLNSMFILKKVTTILSILIFLNIVIWIFVSLLQIKESDFNKIFFALCVITLIFTSIDIYNNLFAKTNKFNLFSLNIYSFIFLSISLTILVFYEYLNLEERIIYEKEKSRIYYELATKDQMTDCYNHQFIVNTLKDFSGQYSLIMFDIDNFKPINDTFGHQCGDFVIKYVASEIKKNVRKNDIVGRYGGDEFIAILPDCSVNTAKDIASSILNGVRKKQSDDNGNQLKLSLSIGIYSVLENEKSSEVLKKTDETLYISKRGGKNQITVYNYKV